MEKPTLDKPLIKSQNLFPVVGIGASAGGLDAFKKLLKAIPEDSGMAYVLVQHLDPNHESLLPEILQKVTPIPVLEITDDIKVLPDHIYVIPSNKMMVATDGILMLAPRPAKSLTGRNLPIDLFFSSLAEVHQEHAIGVVLSGTASDGTQGLKAIKEQGGITFAQDEASAEYEGMPNSAVQAGVVDFILPPEEIPKKLLEVTSKSILSDEELQNIPKQDEDVFKQILSLLRIRKGVDFTYYKQTTIRRRILRRMVVNKNEEPADYLKFLRGNNPEQDLLYQDMLIPVTSFFRDKKVYENLCNEVFPAILKNKIPGEITRIWVAGCSTGQEVYSFAICFKEFLGDNYERLQIFGTDLSEPAILKARTGIYEKSELDSVSPQRLKEYFTKNNGGYQVNKSIRDLCVFAHHNFLKDPPFGKMDCISCRNVLIYMEPYLQKKALTTFHYALNPKGFLLLGKSETTGGVPELFAPASKTDKLYTRKDVQGRFMQVASQRSEQILTRTIQNSKSEIIRTDFQKTADDILLTKYTPAGVVVNDAMDIVHFRGNTANYLEQAPGKPSHNLLTMAKHGLGFELRNILHKAKTDQAVVVKENIPLHVNGALRNISIEALPLPNTLEPYYLVLFHDNNLTDAAGLVTGSKRKVSAKIKQDEKDIRIQLLEQELSQLREDMRSITEEQEASNEELQSANEELLSGSEELQSLNEELETSKEELQSTNEELTVLNHELTGLNEQVTDARNYSESIVATLYQPLLVLDKHLRVKTANQAFYKTFQVDEQETEGVLIYDLGNRQWNIPELRNLLEEVLPQKKQISDFEVTHNFTSIGERIIVLNALEITREKKEEKLILLSIEDITEQRHSQVKEKKFLSRFHNLLLQTSVPIAIFRGSNYIVELVNDSGLGLMVKDKSFIGKLLFEASPELEKPFKEILDKVVESGIPFNANEMEITLFRNGKNETGWFNLHYQAIREDDNTISGILASANEITEQVLARRKIEESDKRYNMMVMQSPFAFAVLKGKDMVITLANDSIKKMWGKGEDIEGKPLIEVLPEIKDQPFPTLLNQVYATGIPFSDNESFVQLVRNGQMEDVYFNFVYQPYREADETISGVTVIANEVTEQVIAKRKIEESEHRYQQMIYSSPSLIAILKGENNIITIANDAIIEIWGKGKDVIGKPFLEALPELIEQGVEQELRNVYTTGIPSRADERPVNILRNGKMELLFYSYVFQAQHNATGAIEGIAIIGSDVTLQALANKKIKASEEQFRSLVMQAPVAICIFKGRDFIVEVANKGFLQIVGKAENEYVGKPVFESVPETRTIAEPLLLEVLKTGVPYFGNEIGNTINRFGKSVNGFWNYVYQPIIGNDGKATGIIVVANEVTEQVLARRKIEESEFRYHEMIYSSPSLMAILKGEDMIIEIANDALLESWGKGKDLIGKSVFDAVPETVEQGFDKLLLSAYKTGQPVRAYEAPVTMLRNGTNELVYYNFIYQAQRNILGEIEGVAIIATEVTPQAALNKKIKESEAFNRTVLESSPDCIKILDADGRLQFMNTNGLCLLEIDDFEPLKNTYWWDMWEPDNQQIIKDAVATAKKGEKIQLQLFGPTVKGTPKWWDIIVSPVLQDGSDKNLNQILSVSRDITRQKLNELKERELLARFQNLIIQAPVAICVLRGKDYVVETMNEGMSEFWGRSVDQSLNKPVFDLLPELRDQGIKELLDNVYNTGERFVMQELAINLIRKGKLENAFVKFVYEPLREADGSISGVMALAHEITEQVVARKKVEESETHFRTMADMMPQKVWTADTQGNYNYFNKCWLDYTGLDFEELKDWGWKKVIHPDDFEETQTKWQHSITTGENFEIEHRLRNTADIYKWHLSRGLLQTDKYGISKMWIGTNTEMQHIKEEEERKGDFIKMVSHELKTPVTSIKGYVQILLMILGEEHVELFPMQIKNSLLRVDYQVTRLTRLITEMLDLSRMEAGKLELQQELFSINALVKDTVDDICLTNPKHTINLHSGFECNIYGDRGRIEQVVINLVTNAIKYSANSYKIEVKIRKGEKNMVLISVQDFGIGIDKADHKKIFDRFCRVEGKVEQTFAGFGIGLFIANEIILRHNGYITVESVKGQGSLFTFSLPFSTETNL